MAGKKFIISEILKIAFLICCTTFLRGETGIVVEAHVHFFLSLLLLIS